MSRRRRWAWIGVPALVGCMPPPMTMGYVAMDPSARGGVDVQGQVGGGAEFASEAGGGGAGVHAEPFVSERVSFPIGTGLVLGGSGGPPAGVFPVRVGFRHRTARHLAWGFGIGPSMYFDSAGPFVSGVADVEIIAGFSRPKVGLSVGFRPAFSFDIAGYAWYGLFEPTVAIPVGPAAVTVGMVGGPWVMPGGGGHAVGGVLGASVGVFRRF